MSGFWLLMVLVRIHRRTHSWSSWPFDACRSLMLLLQPQVMQHACRRQQPWHRSWFRCTLSGCSPTRRPSTVCLLQMAARLPGGVPMANTLCIPSSRRHPLQAPTRCPARSSCVCSACGSMLHLSCHLRQASAQLATSRSSLAAAALREQLHGSRRCGGAQLVGPDRLSLGPAPDSL